MVWSCIRPCKHSTPVPHLCIKLSTYGFIQLPFLNNVSMFLSIFLFIYLSICLSFYLSIYLSVYLSIYLSSYQAFYLDLVPDLSIYLSFDFSNSTAQGGGGSFKNRKPIGEIGCCESRMTKQKHWQSVQLSNWLTDKLAIRAARRLL